MRLSSKRSRPAPSGTLTLSIGGLVGHLQLDGAEPVFLEQLRARYGAFELPTGDWTARDFSLRLKLDRLPPPGASAAARLALTEANPLEVTAGASTIAARRWDFQVRLAGRSSRGRLAYRGQGRCEASPFAVDCVLRVLFATLLPRVGGMLIHGCGLRHAAIGVVFPGVSGTGKTTLARKAPDADDVLSDEIVAVRRLDDGWRVFGTPFWGDFARGGISMRSWPLRTVGFLNQAREVAMTPITSSDATLLAPHLGPEVTRKVPPANARELISEFRALLRKQQAYAFRPKGAGAGSWLKSGDAIAVQRLGAGGVLAPGDVILSWIPGPTPDEDALACHRLPPGGARDISAWGEVLGRVTLVARDGKTRPLTGRVGDLARSFGPLVALPMLRLAGR
jgi:hypothetical protein